MDESQHDPVVLPMMRESARRWLAIIIILIFGVAIMSGFATLWWMSSGQLDERADVALRLSAPVVAVVGTVLGFYFG